MNEKRHTLTHVHFCMASEIAQNVNGFLKSMEEMEREKLKRLNIYLKPINKANEHMRWWWNERINKHSQPNGKNFIEWCLFPRLWISSSVHVVECAPAMIATTFHTQKIFLHILSQNEIEVYDIFIITWNVVQLLWFIFCKDFLKTLYLSFLNKNLVRV